MSYNMQFGLPDYSTPNWTENYLSGLQSLSGPEVPSIPFSPAAANGTPARIPGTEVAALPGYTSLKDAGGIGNYFSANGKMFGNVADLLSKGLGAYFGIKQLGLARDAFQFEKKAYKTNLANQIKSYNTQVGDRIAGRSYATEEERQAALAAAQLPPRG